MTFEFATAGRIIFGAGKAAQAGKLISELGLGRRFLIVTGRHPERHRDVLESLRGAADAITLFGVTSEPRVEDAVQAAAAARAAGCDLVVGLGGGSVLDLAKAASALLRNPGDVFQFLEVIGGGHPLPAPAAPCVAIPTTAGTGSEVTRNAVLSSSAHQIKVSLRHDSMLPRLALVDPCLTLALPRALTASTGCDTLAQLIEPFVSTRANPLTDGFCREGLARTARSLRRACENGSDLDARTDLACASLLGGLALANAGLGAVHGLASPIGGRFPAPHGAVCGVLLASVMEANVAALVRSGGAAILSRYVEIASILTGGNSGSPEAGVAWVRHLVSDLQLPGLATYGITSTEAGSLAAAALRTSSMKTNPVELLVETWANVVTASLA